MTEDEICSQSMLPDDQAGCRSMLDKILLLGQCANKVQLVRFLCTGPVSEVQLVSRLCAHTQLELGFFWDSSGRDNHFLETCIASVGLCFHISPWALERERSNNACGQICFLPPFLF